SPGSQTRSRRRMSAKCNREKSLVEIAVSGRIERMERSDDRRRNQRYPFVLPVSVESEGGPARALLENLSADGLFIQTALRFEVGDPVSLILRLPGSPASFSLAGVVVRVRAVGAEAAGVGVRIPEENSSDRDRLARLAASTAES